MLTLVLLGAGLLAAQTKIFFTQQVALQPSPPGALLAVGPDGVSVVTLSAPPPSQGNVVFASPASPGCAAQAGGIYKFPVTPTTVAVYRNGIRSALPSEYTLSGASLVFKSPIPGETVLCDYTF